MTRGWAAALLALCVGVAGARADASRADSTEHADPGDAYATGPLLLRLSASVSEQQRSQTVQLERRLARLLAAWPGVQSAEVMLTLPPTAEAALDRALPRTTASVVLARSGAEPSVDEVFQLLHSAVPTLAQSDLTLLEHAPAAAARGSSASLPSSQVELPRSRAAAEPAQGSRTIANLRSGLAFSLLANALLAAIVLRKARAVRPSERKVDRRDRTPSPP